MVEVLEATQCYFRGVSDFLVWCFYFFLCESSSLVNCKLAQISILLLFFFNRHIFSMINNSLCSVSSKAYINFSPLTQELTAPK